MFRFGMLALLYFLTVIPSAAKTETADVENKLKEYFHNTAQQVHNEQDSAKKREILDNSLSKFTQALDAVQETSDLGASDKKALGELKARIDSKLSELRGVDGYEKVANSQLDNFADYVQQDMEQADRYVTISVTTVLLVIIILLLL